MSGSLQLEEHATNIAKKLQRRFPDNTYYACSSYRKVTNDTNSLGFVEVIRGIPLLYQNLTFLGFNRVITKKKDL